MKSGTTSIATKEVEQLNAKLEEQKKKLTEIKKLQQQSSSVYNSTLESESKKRGYNSYSELKNTKVLNETQIRKQLGNAEYKQQANLISTINKQVKELENSKEDAKAEDEKPKEKDPEGSARRGRSGKNALIAIIATSPR